MSNLIETFRGNVFPWEVDATEHLTVAYYYQKLEAAYWRFLKLKGVDVNKVRTTNTLTHYKSELRDRDIYRVETGLIKTGARPILGHKILNCETGQVCTTMQQKLVGLEIAGPIIDWDGDEWIERSKPLEYDNWVLSSMDVVRPEEVDFAGNLCLQGYIQRFSTANAFVMSNFGMTSEYLRKSRIGLSTFEFQFEIFERANPGDLLNVESCITHLGNTSMRFYHRMSNAETGKNIADLSQFGVHLDLNARRPSKIPEELRQRAKNFLTIP